MAECPAGRGLLVVAVVLLSCCPAPGSGIALPRLPHADSSVPRWSQSELTLGMGIENVLPTWDLSLPRDGKTEVILYLLQDKLPGGEQLPPVSSRGQPSPAVPADSGVRVSRGGEEGKRSLGVADDVVFRENSKFLTAMERQKWLNSIMRKLVVSQK